MGFRGNRCDAVFRGRSDTKGIAFCRHGAIGRGLRLPGEGWAFGNEQPVQRGRVDDTHHGASVFDDRDVDCELAVLRDEFLGAIKRVDEGEAGTMLRHDAASDGFLSDHLQVRVRLGETFQDDRLGKPVGFSEDRLVQLFLDREVSPVDPHEGRCDSPA